MDKNHLQERIKIYTARFEEEGKKQQQALAVQHELRGAIGTCQDLLKMLEEQESKVEEVQADAE